MIENLHTRAKPFFVQRFTGGMISDSRITVIDLDTEAQILVYWRYFGWNFDAGTKHRGLAIESLGDNQNQLVLCSTITDKFEKHDANVLLKTKNPLLGEPEISSNDLAFAARVLIYTNRLMLPRAQILNDFSKSGIHVTIVSEEELYHSVFISYGGPDEKTARLIDKYLRTRGIKTWFFPTDALPGEKLHRVMHNGIKTHDHVLLLCSKTSLQRPGVLNEIERVLEREANEGGSDIFIPVALDDYVFREWKPSRPDIAQQVRSRVIANLAGVSLTEEGEQEQLNKIIKALQKKN